MFGDRYVRILIRVRESLKRKGCVNFRKMLTVVSMPRLKWSASFGRGDSKDQEWEEAVEAVLRDIAATASNAQPEKKPIVQIVIYESSV